MATLRKEESNPLTQTKKQQKNSGMQPFISHSSSLSTDSTGDLLIPPAVGISTSYLPQPWPPGILQAASKMATQPTKAQLRRILQYETGAGVTIQITYEAHEEIRLVLTDRDRTFSILLPINIFRDFYDEISKQHLADELRK